MNNPNIHQNGDSILQPKIISKSQTFFIIKKTLYSILSKKKNKKKSFLKQNQKIQIQNF